MGSVRLCAFCRRMLPANSHGSKRYCSDEHAREARRERATPERDRRKDELRDGTWLDVNRRTLQTAMQDIVGLAPATAVGYMAVLSKGSDLTRVFPEVFHGQKTRVRINGTFSRNPFFELVPTWEPPRVPESGSYRIVYVREGGIQIAGGELPSVNLPGCHMPKPRMGIHGSDIERVLLQHPTVDQCAAVGRTVANRRIARVFVLLRPETTATEAELFAFLRPRLPEYKWPHSIRIADQLPLDDSGKIAKGSLPSE